MKNWRNDFPIFSHQVDTPFVYFDNAATTQKPHVVLEAMNTFYTRHNTNVHRGLYGMAEAATEQYEGVRSKVAHFINAAFPEEVIFTQGTTDSINTVAQIWARHAIKAGDEIVVSMLEHHSNFVPWQELARANNAILKIIPVLPTGDLDYALLPTLITPRTKLVAVTHVSNALGTRVNVDVIIQEAKKVKAKVLVDGAQAVGFEQIDVQALDCDFYAFSAHKVFGPTGVGVVYVKRSTQEECIPYKFGGGMVHEVTPEITTYAGAPHCFESGTPAIAQVIGLGAALDYVARIGIDALQAHTNGLVTQCIKGLAAIPGVTVLSSGSQKASNFGHIVSFTVKGIHSHDIAAALAKHGICVRAGHHCAQPLAQVLGYPASVRVSFQMYNICEEVEYFLTTLRQIILL